MRNEWWDFLAATPMRANFAGWDAPCRGLSSDSSSACGFPGFQGFSVSSLLAVDDVVLFSFKPWHSVHTGMVSSQVWRDRESAPQSLKLWFEKENMWNSSSNLEAEILPQAELFKGLCVCSSVVVWRSERWMDRLGLHPQKLVLLSSVMMKVENFWFTGPSTVYRSF